MYETDDDIENLQRLLDETRSRAGRHISGIFEGPGPFARLSARELAERLTGMRLLVVGTVTAKGEPRVAPVDGHFHRGRWFFGTASNAFRLRHLRRNPAISAVHLQGEKLFVQVHGTAELIADGTPEFDELDARWVEHYGESVRGAGGDAGVEFVRIHPERMLAYDWPDA